MAKSAKKIKSKSLVIVESPSKAKTIGKFLGSNYKVVASVGHVRDLPKSKLGVDIDDNFEPQYINIRGKGDVIKALKKEAKNTEKIYLATDPDREGEAISWHLAYILGIDENDPVRIEFNEITKNAVKNAVKNPRPININLVDAQQARRVLDRLVGYKISPLLWRKVRRGLSAGRVQSAALNVICERELLIRDFIPQEYWNITAQLKKEGAKRKKDIFEAKLIEKNSKKQEIKNEEQAKQIVKDLEAGSYEISKIEEKERRRRPFAPFTTSSLQQDASNKLGFYTKKTMFIAQQLYEGVEIKSKGSLGLITYIRTDSVRVSQEADSAVKDFIKEQYSDKYLGNNIFTNKKKEIMDAHEAIRPSDVTLTPDSIKESLSNDQYKLYKLIWSRFVASRMASAIFDSVKVDIKNGDYTFRANGSKLKFDGFLKLYNSSDKDDESFLPELKKNELLELVELKDEQKFTQPPLRFTEATLVKELEEKGIGRPSTYVPIMGTLIERRYVSREKKSLLPTDLGFTVNDLMGEYFKKIIDVGFTADMEDRLDDIEENGSDWKNLITDFYGPFSKELEIADKEIVEIKIEDEPTDEICELCGKNMVKKHGRFGEFLACSGYPDCKNTKPIVNKINVKCPSCGKDIVARKSKKGKLFYGCSGYPECKQVFWNKPTEEKCSQCGSLMTEKKTKNGNLLCSNKDCGYVK